MSYIGGGLTKASRNPVPVLATINPLTMLTLVRLGVIASILVLAFFPVPAHAQLLWEVEHTWTVNEVVFSPDGKMLITGSGDFGTPTESLAMWNVNTGEKIAAIEGLGISSVAISLNGKMLAAGQETYTGDDLNAYNVQLWDVATQTLAATLEGHYSKVFAVDFSPDGTLLVSGSNDGTIRLWDVATGDSLASSDWHVFGLFAVWDLQFSPDGTRIAGVGSRQIKIWDTANLATGQEIITLEDDTRSRPISVRWSPDGKMLAAGYGSFGDDAHIRLWDVATESYIATLEGHENRVLALDFSLDGKVLISGSRDDTVRLWDVSTESLITTLEEFDGNVEAVRFSPDGSLFATGDAYDFIKLWDASAWITPTTSVSDDTLPAEVSLVQNYPNPFNPSTTLAYTLNRSGQVELSVYDLTGRVVSVLVNGVQPIGKHEVRFNASGLPTGTYIYRLRTGTETLTRTMTLIR